MEEIIGDDVDLGNLYENIGATGQQAQRFASQLASELPGMTAFKPFTVTSGTSQVQATPEGGFNIGLSPQALANQQALQAQANYYMTQPVQGVNQLGLASQQAFDLANDPNRVALTGPNAYQGYTGLQNQAGGLASQFLGSPAVGSNVSQLGGLQSLYQGMQGLGQTPAGTYATRGAAQQAYGLGGQFMGMAGQNPMQRERDIYGNIRAMQTPEEQRQRMALEERLFNQGRGGVSTNLYGGTPEQLAMAKAQAEAQNQASLMAMEQARAEQLQQANIGSAFAGLGSQLGARDLAAQQLQQQIAMGNLVGAYAPQNQLLALQEASQLYPQLQQRGQLYGAGMFGEASMGGLEAYLGAGLGQANLLGALGTGLLSGLFGTK